MNVKVGFNAILVCCLGLLLFFFLGCGEQEAKKAEFQRISAIAKAKGQDPISKEAAQFGLKFRQKDHKRYKQIRERLFANDTLVSALKIAKDMGVNVYLGEAFQIGRGWVDIDVNASDEEIIEFLLGSDRK